MVDGVIPWPLIKFAGQGIQESLLEYLYGLQDRSAPMGKPTTFMSVALVRSWIWLWIFVFSVFSSHHFVQASNMFISDCLIHHVGLVILNKCEVRSEHFSIVILHMQFLKHHPVFLWGFLAIAFCLIRARKVLLPTVGLQNVPADWQERCSIPVSLKPGK